MPPRRRKTTRASARASADAEAAVEADSNAGAPAETPRTRSATISTRLAPLPAKHSTSYGSPAPVLPLQSSGQYGSDLKSATRDMLAAVEKANKETSVKDRGKEKATAGKKKDTAPVEYPTLPDVPEESASGESSQPTTPPHVRTPSPSSSREFSPGEDTPEEEENQEQGVSAGPSSAGVPPVPTQRQVSPRKSGRHTVQAERQRQEQQRRREEAERQQREEAERQQREEQHQREKAQRQQRRNEEATRQGQELENRVLTRAAERAQREQAASRQAYARSSDGNRPFPEANKRSGEELIEDIFTSPKRPRLDQAATPIHDPARRRVNLSEPPEFSVISNRSFIEESIVFKDAHLQTPTTSSEPGDTPCRIQSSRAIASRAVSLPPNTQQWEQGPVPSLPRPAGPSTQNPSGVMRPTEERWAARKEPALIPGTDVLPRQSNHQSRVNYDFNQGRRPFVEPTVVEPTEESDSEQEHTVLQQRSSPDPAPFQRRPAQQAEETTTRSRRPDNSESMTSHSSNSRQDANPIPPSEDEQETDHAGLYDSILKARNKIYRYLGPSWRVLRWLFYPIAFLLVISIWTRAGSAEWEDARINLGLRWHGFSHMGQNIGQFVPYTLQHPLGFLTDEEYSSLRHVITEHGVEIRDLMRDNDDIHRTTKKLEQILPKVVSVKRDKTGSKLVIGQDFWHALKDLMHAETSILTLRDEKDGSKNISDQHWMALLKRFKAEGIPDEASWENWLKNNRGKVERILGISPGQSSGFTDEKRLEKLIRDHLATKKSEEIVVTRQEFIREVQTSLDAHKREVDAELTEVREKLQSMVNKAAESGGLTRAELGTLVNDAVSRAISNARLEGGAKHSIYANFELELSRRVNYFGQGNGAMLNTPRLSPTWNPPPRPAPFGSTDWTNQGAPRFDNNHMAVLTKWDEAGDCWCGGGKIHKRDGTTDHRTKKRVPTDENHPVDISIILPHHVVPDYMVIEHIDPAATLDPGSMPKDIEIWAIVEEHSRRTRVLDFMATQYPDLVLEEQAQTALGYLKIGEFTYEHDRATNGVQVYKFSEELAKMDITSDEILVRARTNYGADHTCFYRIRFYGTAPDDGLTKEV